MAAITVPELDDDKGAVFEDFFLFPASACLRILLWPTFC
jgi:hypothetical protein